MIPKEWAASKVNQFFGELHYCLYLDNLTLRTLRGFVDTESSAFSKGGVNSIWFCKIERQHLRHWCQYKILVLKIDPMYYSITAKFSIILAISLFLFRILRFPDLSEILTQDCDNFHPKVIEKTVFPIFVSPNLNYTLFLIRFYS